MTIINKKVSELIPYAKNTKMHDKTQIKNVAESIKQFGFVQPVVIDKDNVIVIGHCRTLAAKKLKMDEVPCVLVDTLTEEQIKALRIIDNKTNESPWEMEFLAEELESISLDGFEFDFMMEEPDEVEQIIEDIPPEVNDEEPPKTQPGDIYILGDHKLMCGDSTKEEDVARLMDGETADLVETDPPYNVNVSNSKGLKLKNDNMEKENFLQFLSSAFSNVEKFLKPGGAFYIWLASSTWLQFETALNENNLYIRQELIWNKSQAGLSRSDYHWKHEPCFYGWKEGAAHYFIDDYTQTTVISEEVPNPDDMKKEELIKWCKKLLAENNKYTTVIDEAKPQRSELHPTMKPLKLIGRQISNSSKPGEIVLDLFGGSGSTMMACEQLNRKCRMMEYDPKYADVIVQRWEELTGEKAVLIRKGE